MENVNKVKGAVEAIAKAENTNVYFYVKKLLYSNTKSTK